MLTESLMQYYKKNSLFLKIQFLMIMLIIGSIGIVSYVFYQRSRDLLIENFTDSRIETMNQVSQSQNIHFRNLLDISKHLYNNDRLNELMKEKNIQGMDDLVFLNDISMQFKHANDSIFSVYLYLDRAGRIFDVDSGFWYTGEFADTYFLTWFNKSSEILQLLDTHEITNPATPLDEKKINVFSICVRLPMEYRQSYDGALVMNVRQDHFYSEILDKDYGSGDAVFLILDEEDRIIFSKDESLLYKSAVGEFGLVLNKSMSSSSTGVKIGEEDYLVIYSRENDFGWTYVIFESLDKLESDLEGIRRIIILISILVLAVGISLSFFLNHKVVDPVDSIIDRLRREESEGDDDVNQLAYLQSSIIGLLEKNSQLKDQMDAALPALKDDFVKSLLLNGDLTSKEILFKKKLYDLDLPHGNILLALFDFSSPKGKDHVSNMEEGVIQIGLRGVISQYLGERKLKTLSVEPKSRVLALLIDRELRDTEQVIALIRELQDYLHDQLGLFVTASLHDTPVTLTELSSAYLLVEKNLANKLLFNGGELLVSSRLVQKETPSVLPDSTEQGRLAGLIKHGREEDAIALFDAMVTRVHQSESAGQFQIFTMTLCSDFLTLLHELDQTHEMLLGSLSSYDFLQSLDSRIRIVETYTRFIRDLCRLVNESTNRRTKIYLKRIIDFIHGNYQKDISLDDLCSSIDLSKSYINQILKETNNDSFVQILNEYRIEKARELLEHGEHRIGEIAEAVGFNSSKYFIRTFKRITGVTPGSYIS